MTPRRAPAPSYRERVKRFAGALRCNSPPNVVVEPDVRQLVAPVLGVVLQELERQGLPANLPQSTPRVLEENLAERRRVLLLIAARWARRTAKDVPAPRRCFVLSGALGRGTKQTAVYGTVRAFSLAALCR